MHQGAAGDSIVCAALSWAFALAVLRYAAPMKRYADLLADAQSRVKEIMPWDLSEWLARDAPPLVVDVREPDEFAALRIAGSINVPRGVLEQACEWDFDFTVPPLAAGRDAEIVVLCRSGTRSLLAADAMQQMGFARVASLRTGLRGWNDFEQPLIDAAGERIDIEAAQALLSPQVRADQRMPRR